MAYTNEEKINQAQKLSQQIIDGSNTSPGSKWWYNAQRAWEPYSKPYWSEKDSIPGADTPAEADSAVSSNPTILEKKKIRLTLDITSNNRQYECRDTYGDITSDTIEDWIQPSLILNNGAASNGYIVRLYHGDPDSGGVEITTTYNSGSGGEPCWSFYYAPGIMLVSTDQSSNFKTFYDTNGLWVVGYRYIGDKVDSVGVLNSGFLVQDSGSDILATTSGLNFTGDILATDAGNNIVDISLDVYSKTTTTTDINMVVDPVSGSSPPAGTIVRSQAEYDALGYNLLYVQDAIDILPSFIPNSIQVKLLPGTHLAKTDELHPFGHCAVHITGLRGDNDSDLYTFTGKTIYANTIDFYSDESDDIVVEAAQSGTASVNKVTRSSGTWTVDEHRGLFIKFTSGANNGKKYIIEQNTATELYVCGVDLTAGACNFQITRPGAEIVGSTDGVSGNAFTIVNIHEMDNYKVGFYNIAFGSNTFPNGSFQAKDLNYLTIKNCYFKTNTDIFLRLENVSFSVDTSSFIGDATGMNNGLLLKSRPALQSYFIKSYVEGNKSAANNNPFFRGLVNFYCGEVISVNGATFRISGSGDSILVNVVGPYSIQFATDSSASWGRRNRFIGEGNGIGLQVDSDFGKPNVTVNNSSGAQFTFENLDIGIKVLSNCTCILEQSTISSSSVTEGWVLNSNAFVCALNLDDLTASTDISIDGIDVSYSEFSEDGDSIVGPYHSKIVKL
ncbi:hypothetical protein GF373_17490 [bacterium]|nr:hypothetical protein [bacterium]